jgi:phosphonate transport system substrate-binding protein
MPTPLSRRLFLLQLGIFTFSACKAAQQSSAPLLIGVISYPKKDQTTNRYEKFSRYLSSELKAHVEIEPTFNERKALERIQSQAWSLVLAPPGVAAIAIKDFQYLPVFPLQEDMVNLRSLLIVQDDSPFTELNHLQGKAIALGQIGSVTDYYFPLYNLYGLTLSEVLLASTPEDVIKWVAEGKVAAGAISTTDFKTYSPQFKPTEFRILHADLSGAENSKAVSA